MIWLDTDNLGRAWPYECRVSGSSDRDAGNVGFLCGLPGLATDGAGIGGVAPRGQQALLRRGLLEEPTCRCLEAHRAVEGRASSIPGTGQPLREHLRRVQAIHQRMWPTAIPNYSRFREFLWLLECLSCYPTATGSLQEAPAVIMQPAGHFLA